MKRALLAATAVLWSGFAPIAMTPAFADETDNIILTPLQDDTGLTPDEVCEEVLRPAAQAGFMTAAGAVTEGSWINDGALVIGDAVGPLSGYGTPTYTNVFFSSGFYRNGGSPNVWGGATATETYDQSQQMHSTTQPVKRTDTFDCMVWKDPGGDAHGPDAIYPPGLQTTGNSVTQHDVVAGPDQNVITGDDYVTTGATVYTLICISPNSTTKAKPGTWTQKHGFTGSCSTASSIAGGSIPSGNAPVVD